MILLITPSARGQECAASLKADTGSETHWAENLQQAMARLREQSYSAVVLDQFLLENEPAESDQVLEHLGTAFPVYLNFAVSGMERLLREVRSALHRRKREETQARRSVEQQIRSEMCESLTAMLLSCELAMSVPEVPAPGRGENPPHRQSRPRHAPQAGGELTHIFDPHFLKMPARFRCARRPVRTGSQVSARPPSKSQDQVFSLEIILRRPAPSALE